MILDEKLTREIVRRVLDVAHPDRIILFGSAATGEMTEDSDIDLLILLSEHEDWKHLKSAIRKVLSDIDFSFDVILRTPQRFDEYRDIIGGVEYPAYKYGKVLYDAR